MTPNWHLGVMTILFSVALMVYGQYHNFTLGEFSQRTIKVLALMTYPVYLLHESFGLSLISLEIKSGLNVIFSYGSTFAIVVLFSYLLVTKLDPIISRQMATSSRLKTKWK